MTRAYLELFAGGAACALALMGGASAVPPVGYMGLDLRDGQPGKLEWLTCSHPPHHLARPQLALPPRGVA